MELIAEMIDHPYISGTTSVATLFILVKRPAMLLTITALAIGLLGWLLYPFRHLIMAVAPLTYVILSGVTGHWDPTEWNCKSVYSVAECRQTVKNIRAHTHSLTPNFIAEPLAVTLTFYNDNINSKTGVDAPTYQQQHYYDNPADK